MTETIEQITVTPEGVAPGMYLRFMSGHRIFVLSRDGETVRCVWLPSGDAPEHAMLESRSITIYSSYDVIEPDPDLTAALAHLLQREPDDSVVREARYAGIREEADRWRGYTSRFNSDFWERVDCGDFDGDAADRLAENHDTILESRYSDYCVNYDVSGSFSHTVRARDEDHAQELADEEISLADGYHTIGDEEVYISNVEVSSVESC